jgi:hypothetical protein
MKNNLIITLAAALAVWSQPQGVRAALYNNDTDVAIPDYPGTGASSLITSTGSGLVAVSSLTFTITGGWAGDYTLALQYTDGTAAISTTYFSLLQGGAAKNSGFDNVTLTSVSGYGDITTAGSTTSSSAITGTYSVNFSAFDSVSANGDWILFVRDLQSGDSGTLTGWSLELTAVPEPVNLALAILGAVAGIFALRQFVTAFRKTPAPAPEN